MTKDTPSYLMIVQRGRLVPAGPIDEERLMTYQDGTEVECVWKSVKNGKLIRKLYVVTDKAVKQCPTPWATADEAVQAMKDALGIVEFGPNVRGTSMRYLRSLNDLEEPELEEFLEGCWLILQKVTGVDPLTLRKEAGDTISRDSASPDPSPEQAEQIAVEEDGGGVEAGLVCPIPDAAPAADSSPENPDEIDAQAGEGQWPRDESPDAGAATEVETDDAPPPNVSASNPSPDDPVALRAEMVSKLFRLASEPLTVQDRLEALDSARPGWEERLPGNPTLVRQMFETVAKVIKGQLAQDAARKFVDQL